MKFFTATQTKQAENYASRLGMNHLRLMENAGSAAARALRLRSELGGKNIAVVCGKGNNGGDGFVVARKLFDITQNITIILAAGMPKTGDASEMFSRAKSLGINILDYSLDKIECDNILSVCDLIVDAVFGIGFKGVPDDTLSTLFRKMSFSKAQVGALDIPSGTDGDTGEVEGECVKADFTISFNTYKPAHALFPAAAYCGELILVPIGMPDEALSSVSAGLNAIDFHDVIKNFSPRDPRSNKGTFGRALHVCGSFGMSGAAALSAKAALKCGAGLVELAVPNSIYPILAGNLLEPVMTPLAQASSGTLSRKAMPKLLERLKSASSVLFGCGWGKSYDLQYIAKEIITSAVSPVVIDADGINAIGDNIDILQKAVVPVIITPHPGEMARLLKVSVEQVQSSRLECARDFAAMYGVILVLKGANTIVAMPDSSVFINFTGNAGMATGGTGDVLAGMVASLLAQGIGAPQAAISAVYIHGKAGDIAAKRVSQHSLTASDVIDDISTVFLEIESAVR